MPRVSKKEEPKKVEKKSSVKKEEFNFKPINLKEEPKSLSKDERRAMIEELVGTPKNSDTKKFEYTLDETEFEAREWVVCINTLGHIFQEPVPRYCDYQSFVYLLAGIPDNPSYNTKTVSLEVDYYLTKFEVKNVDCHIVSSSNNGSRSPNAYADCFDIENGTKRVGGNIVFAGHDKGFTKKEAKEVVNQIIKTFNSKEF